MSSLSTAAMLVHGSISMRPACQCDAFSHTYTRKYIGIGSPFDTRARAFFSTHLSNVHNTRKVSNEIALNTRSASVGVRARARACAWIIFAYTAAHAISEVVLALTGSERVFAGLRSHRSVSASTPGSKDPPRESSPGIEGSIEGRRRRWRRRRARRRKKRRS